MGLRGGHKITLSDWAVRSWATVERKVPRGYVDDSAGTEMLAENDRGASRRGGNVLPGGSHEQGLRYLHPAPGVIAIVDVAPSSERRAIAGAG